MGISSTFVDFTRLKGGFHCNKALAKSKCLFAWCERGDSNPHGITTRTSNVLVYHSNTLASAWILYPISPLLSILFYGIGR